MKAGSMSAYFLACSLKSNKTDSDNTCGYVKWRGDERGEEKKRRGKGGRFELRQRRGREMRRGETKWNETKNWGRGERKEERKIRVEKKERRGEDRR